jgi:hypothetical protein
VSSRWSRPKLGSAGRSSQDEADNDQGRWLVAASGATGDNPSPERAASLVAASPSPACLVGCIVVAVPCRDRGLGKEVTVASSWFEMRYTQLLEPFLTATGMGPAESGIEVTSEELRVQMGWAFRAHIPIRDVRQAEQSAPAGVLGWGVHGGAGRWLVNGSRQGVVRIEIDPATRGRVMGVPVQLAVLLVSVVEPEKFVDTVNRSRVA